MEHAEYSGFACNIIRSSRKTLALEIRTDGSVVIRAPYTLPDRKIQEFVAQKENWIRKTLEKVSVRENIMPQSAGFSEAKKRMYKRKAAETLSARVHFFARQMGVSFSGITVREQKTRWGSCSSLGNLNFNWKLILAPPEILDYVVVHELCHRKEMNHSPAFWREVEKVLPDYEARRQWLKENGWKL